MQSVLRNEPSTWITIFNSIFFINTILVQVKILIYLLVYNQQNCITSENHENVLLPTFVKQPILSLFVQGNLLHMLHSENNYFKMLHKQKKKKIHIYWHLIVHNIYSLKIDDSHKSMLNCNTEHES